MTETTTTESPTVSLKDLDTLVAACTAWMPSDASVDVQDAFARLVDVYVRASGEHARVEAAARAAGEGETYFANISFMGRIEYWGVRVTEITKHGQAAYRIEKPGHVFGGDPYAVSYHAAQSWFSEERVTEQSARAAWDKRLKDAEERRKREEAWEAEQAKRREQRALTSGHEGRTEHGDGCDDACCDAGYSEGGPF